MQFLTILTEKLQSVVESFEYDVSEERSSEKWEISVKIPESELDNPGEDLYTLYFGSLVQQIQYHLETAVGSIQFLGLAEDIRVREIPLGVQLPIRLVEDRGNPGYPGMVIYTLEYNFTNECEVVAS